MEEAVEPHGWFPVPGPVRQLFDLFPLNTLPAEALPTRSPARYRQRPRLYVYGREDDDLAALGLPNFNPSCLKWQTFLRIAGVYVEIVVSNNHASPSGALPCLLPPSSPSGTRSIEPLTGGSIGLYARKNSLVELPPESPRTEAYSALIAQSIRPAWLYMLYLDPRNEGLLISLYLPSSSPLLRYSTLLSLRQAAHAEILNTTRRPTLDPEALFSDFDDALRALSTLLGRKDEWFFGAAGPGLLDAEVFAYTHLLLDSKLGVWKRSEGEGVYAFGNLVEHSRRLYAKCWPTLLRQV